MCQSFGLDGPDPNCRLLNNAQIGRVAALVALGAAVFMRLWNLGRQSLSMDEVWELQIANAPWLDIHLIDDGFPPLFHYLLKAGVGIFGTDHIARWLAALAGLATIWVVYRLGSSLAGSRAGWASALAMAWLPLHIHLSRDGRVYSLMILAAAIVIWAAWELRTGSGHYWPIYAIGLVAGIWLHYAFAGLALLLAVITYVDEPDRKRWWITHGLVGLLALPLIAPLLGDLTPHTTLTTAPDLGLAELGYLGKTLLFGFALGPSSRALHTLSVGEAFGQTVGLAVVLVPSMGLLIFRSWKSESWSTSGRRFVAVVLTGGIAITVILIAVSGIGFQVRYFAWLLVPIALWLGPALAVKQRLVFVAIALCGVAVAVSVFSREFVAEHQNEDSRAISEFLTDSDDYPTFALSWYMANPVNYYLTPEAFLPLEDPRDAERVLGPRNKPGQAVRPLSDGVGAPQSDGDVFRLIDDDVAPGGAYYLLYSRPFHGDDDGSFLAAATARDNLVLIHEVTGYRVYQGSRGE